MRRKKIVIIAICIAIIFSVSFIKLTYAGWFEDLWEAITEAVEHWVSGHQKTTPPVDQGGTGLIIPLISTDSATWTNYSNIDSFCVVGKLTAGTDKALLSKECQRCLSKDTTCPNCCQECINQHRDEWLDAIREIILEGECSFAASAGYDAAVASMQIRPARLIAGENFDLTVGITSAGPATAYTTYVHGVLRITNENGAEVYSEGMSGDGRIDFERIKILEAGRYTAAFLINKVYIRVSGPTQVRIDEVADSNSGNNTMQISFEVLPNPATQAVALHITNENPITLSWSRYSEGDFHKYEAHRSTNRNFTIRPEYPLQVILDSANTTYVDNQVEPGRTYYYKIRVCDITGECAISNEVSATAPPVVTPEVVEPPVAHIHTSNEVISNVSWHNGRSACWARLWGDGMAQEGFSLSGRCELDFGDGNIITANLDSNGAYHTEYAYPESGGDYTVRFRVEDSRGIWSEWASLVVTVIPSGPHTPLPPEPPEALPPQVTFEPPAITKQPNEYFYISAVATDPNPGGAITKYEWDLDGDGVYEWCLPSPYCIYRQPGVYYAQVQVTNAAGLTATARLKIVIELVPQEQPQAAQQTRAPSQGADLQLIEGTLEFSAPALKVGKEIKIAVKVKNAGIKRLSPVEVEFWADEENIGEATINALAPQEEESARILWMPERPGHYIIYAILDPINRFDETNEANNRTSRSINISARGD